MDYGHLLAVLFGAAGGAYGMKLYYARYRTYLKGLEDELRAALQRLRGA